ncbi:hypothetical protein G6F22_018316 [Rhizopus arrhizus]|nr:hypothetical protein G6F22_018316 [Rhizopus arrhizus]KAG1246472.1 hypothetical protein G6F68_014625 [Rhizopus microsporus]
MQDMFDSRLALASLASCAMSNAVGCRVAARGSSASRIASFNELCVISFALHSRISKDASELRHDLPSNLRSKMDGRPKSSTPPVAIIERPYVALLQIAPPPAL